MNKKILHIAYILVLFLLFIIFEIDKNTGTRVIEIISPTKVVVDLNSNGINDEGETICVPEIQTFTSNISINQNDLMKALKLSQSDAINAGYMADEFAKEFLLNKKVKIEIKPERTMECKFADIYADGVNYSKSLRGSGHAIIGGKTVNPELFEQELEEARALNLVILNRKSGKFHKLDCRYGIKSGDFLILPMAEAELQFEKCKYCIVRPEQSEKLKKKEEKTLDKSTYPEYKEVKGIKFILSDYTNRLSPHTKCDHYFCKETVNLINNTHSTLDMAVYEWSKIPDIERAIQAAKERGVQIRAVFEVKPDEPLRDETAEFLSKIENKRPDEIPENKKLTSMLMHNKFIISDNKTIMTGSMNFSRTGFSGFNANNVVIISSPELASYYTKEFEQMYSGRFHTLKTQIVGGNTFTVGNTRIGAYFSPQDKTVENALVPLVEKAEKYIYLPVFVITHKKLTQSLIDAKNRGVDVKIILDATSVRSNHTTHEVLRNAGIPLKTENYAGKVHNKSMIIDDKYVITGSMNFSNSGENRNDENCLVIENTELAKFYRGWFEFIWKKIPDIYLKYSVRPESRYSVGSCYDGVDNDFDGKVDFNDDGCR